MSPLGPYPDYKACVLANKDKRDPKAYCGFLENRINNQLPDGFAAEYPEPWFKAYSDALLAKKSEPDAWKLANEAAAAAGFEFTRQGWTKLFQAPKMKSIAGAEIFAEGTWTDSSGESRKWTGEDLDNMVAAFKAGVPGKVPVKCGHTSDAFNRKIAEALGVPVEVVTGDNGHGAISLGDMSSLEHRGSSLIAGFDKLPEQIAALVEGGQFNAVSVEIEDQVGDFGPVITGVALLGAEEPAVDKARLATARVFAFSKREGARELFFAKNEEVPTLKNKVKAMFAGIGELIDKLVGNAEHSAPGENPPPASDKAKDGNSKKEGTIMDLKKLAAALGLGEMATEAEIMAKIAELVKGGTPPAVPAGMSKELEDAKKTIADLLKKATGQERFAKWAAKVAKFTAIPGKPEDFANQLSSIEEKAGEEAANAQFAALDSANTLSAEAQRAIGTTRKAEPTDWDNEVAKFQKENPQKSKAEVIDAVSKAKPDLYLARRG